VCTAWAGTNGRSPGRRDRLANALAAATRISSPDSTALAATNQGPHRLVCLDVRMN
jgi:hypothetical protein